MEILLETGAGDGAFHTDGAYEKAGVRIMPVAFFWSDNAQLNGL
jgi:NAD/NADP transhydrogenase alpha subunit